MQLDKVRYGVSGGVATIALDDPPTRNALSDRLLDDLLAALAAAKGDAAARCVVLTSTHDEVFSSGGDLQGFAADVPPARRHLDAGRFPRLFTALGELGKPSLCAAGGHVLAGAVGLALACDLVMAREGVTFATPELDVGLFPFMVMALLYRNVGRKKANQMLLLGERVPAREAERIGMVNRVVPAGEFDAAVAEWAQRLAARSPLLMRLGKDAMFTQMDLPLAQALDYLRTNLALALASEDTAEGVAAFFEKRAPDWRGR